MRRPISPNSYWVIRKFEVQSDGTCKQLDFLDYALTEENALTKIESLTRKLTPEEKSKGVFYERASAPAHEARAWFASNHEPKSLKKYNGRLRYR